MNRRGVALRNVQYIITLSLKCMLVGEGLTLFLKMFRVWILYESTSNSKTLKTQIRLHPHVPWRRRFSGDPATWAYDIEVQKSEKSVGCVSIGFYPTIFRRVLQHPIVRWVAWTFFRCSIELKIWLGWGYTGPKRGVDLLFLVPFEVKWCNSWWLESYTRYGEWISQYLQRFFDYSKWLPQQTFAPFFFGVSF